MDSFSSRNLSSSSSLRSASLVVSSSSCCTWASWPARRSSSASRRLRSARAVSSWACIASSSASLLVSSSSRLLPRHSHRDMSEYNLFAVKKIKQKFMLKQNTIIIKFKEFLRRHVPDFTISLKGSSCYFCNYMNCCTVNF